MGNHFFRFKQFTVHQDACAMKVCTDACIQGAFTATLQPATRVLDIGAGTGLLSLMLAQQWPNTQFTAVELDGPAASQAAQNFAASPWAERFSVVNTDIRKLSASPQYDFIISNPPFYEADLKSPHALRNQAMHATTLDYTELLKAVDNLLTQDGLFSVLLPAAPFNNFMEQAKGLFPKYILHVRQSTKHNIFRSIGIFSRTAQTPVIQTMAIREADNTYSSTFTALLQSYYLYLDII